MALATKCPHCNTVFRVAHDQLKLRGGIVRCGSCNEVFDGNAALLEPSVAAPEVTPHGGMPGSDPAWGLTPASPGENEAQSKNSTESADARSTAPDATPHGGLPGSDPWGPTPSSPGDNDAQSTNLAPDAVESHEPEIQSDHAANQSADDELADELPQPEITSPELNSEVDIKPLTHEELEVALAAELALIEQSIVTANAADSPAAPSAAPATRREPTLAPEPRFDLDEADEEALVQLAARERDTTPETHTLLRAASAPSQDRFEPQSDLHRLHDLAPAPAPPPSPAPVPAIKKEEPEDPNEPGFVKRDRRRERYGKSTTIAMAAGSLLLVGALAAQGMTTFRNQLAANYPALKPALQGICATLGCKIELPTQIDQLVIEQGELQTLSETTFSFSTLLRNQSASAQTWPHIELVLDDANDKAILRRVFTPRDYLGAGTALDKGFAPRSEQSVKLTFELKQLKASGYHIAVFYP